MKETYYFSHDYNAHLDPKCSAMISDLGIASYGTYWAVIELSYQQGGKIKKFPKLYDGLSFQFHIKKDLLTKQLEAMLHDYELLQEDEKYIWSDRVLRNLEIREEKRLIKSEAGRIGGLKSGETRRKRSKTKQPFEANEANEAKERKGKERKGKDIINTKTETAIAVLEPKTSNEVTFVYDIFKNHYGVSPKPIKAKGSNFDLNVAAAKRLVKVHGRETLEAILKFTLKYQNTDRYCRISTSPLDFEKNYSWYKTYFEQKKIELSKRRVEKLT